MPVNLKDMISQKEAADVRGCSIQTINSLIKRGRLKTFVIGGKIFVSKKEVKNYKPGKGGRPKKSEASKPGPRKSR